MSDNLKSMRISGSGSVHGGVYDEVKISGSGRISGDVECTSLKVSGSAKIEGKVKTGECRISGSANIEGELIADDIHISGSTNADGDLIASNDIKISGGAKVGGALKAGNIRLSGGVSVQKGIECEILDMSGAFKVTGLINAGTLNVRLNGDSRAEDIGGDEIIVLRERDAGIKRVFGINIPISFSNGTLTADTIEGGKIHLEYTRAKVVRGEVIEIGPGCSIDKVEYSGSLIVDEEAQVSERVKI